MTVLERLAPQMETYSRFGYQCEWCPYLMFLQKRNFISKEVNTDCYGIRLSVDQRGIYGLEIKDEPSCNVLIGNSMAFGVGASSDSKTVASLLSREGERWINMTGRAYSGMQELLMFLAYRDHLPKVRRVIILSGVNDLYMSFAPRLFDETFGPFLYSDRFSREFNVGSLGYRDLAKLILRKVVSRLRKAPKPNLQAGVEDRWRRKETVLPPIRKTLSAWGDLARGGGFELTYALQPIESFIQRERHPSEVELMDYLDSLPSSTSKLAQLVLTHERYEWYRAAVRQLCQENKIRFVDLNEIFPTKGWHFVDRFHLTDEGQRVTSDLLREEMKKK